MLHKTYAHVRFFEETDPSGARVLQGMEGADAYREPTELESYLVQEGHNRVRKTQGTFGEPSVLGEALSMKKSIGSRLNAIARMFPF